MAEPQEDRSPSLDDCLKLLKEERDELVTKFCRNDDLVSLKNVYEAVGAHFLLASVRVIGSYLILKMEQIRFSPDLPKFSSLPKALAYWADGTKDPSVVMMASSICSLIYHFTSEEALLKQPSLNGSTLDSLARLIARSLSSSGQDMSDTADLLELITSEYSRWANRFPTIKQHNR